MIGGPLSAYWVMASISKAAVRIGTFPLLFQCIFAISVISVTFWLPETPCWLMWHDPTPNRPPKLRGISTDYHRVQHEHVEILDAIALGEEEGSWSDRFRGHGIRRLKLTVTPSRPWVSMLSHAMHQRYINMPHSLP